MNQQFRNYKEVLPRVKETYKKGRCNQNLQFYHTMKQQYDNREKKLINIWNALNMLNHFVDQSDPDMDLPNIQHLFQSAEAARKDNLPEWLQLTCLIHDLGKIMYLFGNHETGTSMEQQWAIVGDTFILGCKIPDTIVFPEFNKHNKDHNKYNELGVYHKNCGLDECKVSWGHDEFLYQTLKNNPHNLPPESLYIIRYHSLYLYHTYGEYQHLLNDYDREMLKWVQLFNKYDLYSKENKKIEIETVKEYYQGLICKFLGKGNLYW
tara:strand:+ start:378 stop:1172 length:795 start_codon:yes stop_codon:yes gene_type:complete